MIVTAGVCRERTSAGGVSATPAVSVVVPCFNGGRFLDSLMASLACQTFRDFEVVIVDDGSSDPQTLRKLLALEGRATVIRQMNRGPAAARNTGIRRARADIVFALDCDDTIEPEFLAETVSVLHGSPPDVGMVFSDLRLAGAESGLVSRYFNRFDLLFTNTLSSGLVMRRDAWLAAGGYDEAMRSGYEDWDFSLRLAEAGYRGLRIARPLYIYHIADDTAPSRSTDIDTKRLYGGLWRHIRERHANSYTMAAMLRLWNASQDGSGRVPLWKGLVACALARVLPDAAFNLLIARLHRRPRADAARLPVGPSLFSTAAHNGN